MSNFLQKPRLMVGVITLLAALLRLLHLDYKSLWLDEAVIWEIASHPLPEAVAQNAGRNSAPPLFIILLKSIMLVGDSEFMLRLLPAITGIVAVPVMYALAHQFLPRPASYFTTVLVAVSYSMVYYSQQVREYSLTFLLAALLLLCFYRFLRVSTWQRWLPLVAVLVVSILAQYGLAVLILALNIIWAIEWLIVRSKSTHDSARWAAAQAVAAIMAAIVYFLSLRTQMVIGFGAQYLADGYWDGTLSGIMALVLNGTDALLRFAYTMPIPGIESQMLLVGLLAIGVWGILRTGNPTNSGRYEQGARHGETRRIVLLLLAVPFTVVLAFALARLYPYTGVRQSIFLTPMLFITAGYGYSWLTARFPQWWVGAGIAVLFIVPGISRTLEYLDSYGGEHMRPLMVMLKSELLPGDRIYINDGAAPAFNYYYREVNQNIYVSRGMRGQPETFYAEIDRIFEAEGRVWFLLSHCVEDVCTFIPEYAATLREVELKGKSSGAFLYAAP